MKTKRSTRQPSWVDRGHLCEQAGSDPGHWCDGSFIHSANVSCVLWPGRSCGESRGCNNEQYSFCHYGNAASPGRWEADTKHWSHSWLWNSGTRWHEVSPKAAFSSLPCHSLVPPSNQFPIIEEQAHSWWPERLNPSSRKWKRYRLGEFGPRKCIR